MKTKTEILIEAAMFIEREAYLLKQSETKPDGSWPYLDVKEEYEMEISLAKGLREIAAEVEA